MLIRELGSDRMKELVFYYGAMGCGKTRRLQDNYYGKIEDGFKVIIVKPFIDKKGDKNIISRDGNKIKVDFLISKKDNIYSKIAEYIYDNKLDYILVDEAQFLEAKQVEELGHIVNDLGINVICYGLRTDFRGYLFEGSKRLFEVADRLYQLERQCSCGRVKIYNMRMVNDKAVFDGDIVAIDGIDAVYKSVCSKCFCEERKIYINNKKD